jgi:hypothetical protein
MRLVCMLLFIFFLSYVHLMITCTPSAFLYTLAVHFTHCAVTFLVFQ